MGCKMKRQTIWMSMNGIFGGRIKMCPTCNYLNINQLKKPVHLNIILFLSEVFYRVLPSIYVVKVVSSCVSFVPLICFLLLIILAI